MGTDPIYRSFVLLTGLLVAFAAAAATMPPVHMKVVDGADGSAVAGAFVLFSAQAHEGSITGHGGREVTLFAAEAVTNDAGELDIAKQDFSAQPFFLNTVLHNPQMTIFKPGYATLILVNQRKVVPDLKEVTSWTYDGQTVRLKRAASDKDTAEAAHWAAENARMSVDPRSCSWKHIPRFLVAVDRAAADWERKRSSRTDELRYRSVRSPLRDILMNDQLFAQKDCGSPQAFFEPYLR
jgi:hypothetical protein